jgi:transcriptional/translational regulatory protein YebC/TACO1
MTAVIDAGADDIREEDEQWEVVTSPEAYESVLAAVREAGIEPASAQLAMLPQNYVKLEGAPARQILKVMELLEDHDDVRHVWSNFDIDAKEIEASLA